MAISMYYDVSCNVCEKELYSRMAGLPVDNMATVQRHGWLILFDSNGENPYAAICPDCWRQIADCWKQAGQKE